MDQTIEKVSLNESFALIEKIIPSIQAKPGYFKYNPHIALKLAEWIERYQSLVSKHVEKLGTYTFSNFDTETTGLNKPEDFKAGLAGITDIAVSRMPEGIYKGNDIDEDGNQSTLQTPFEFESLSNPGVNIPEEVVLLTGITNSMAHNSSPQTEVIEKFREYTENTILMGHNVGDSLHNKKGYDIYNVLGPIYEREFGVSTDMLLNNSIDTLPLFRFLIAGISHTNDDFCRLLGVKLKGAHRAMPDVRANALAFSKIKPFLDSLDTSELREYAKAQLSRDNFIVSSVRQGALDSTQWCEVVLRMDERFKVKYPKTGRMVVNYATVKITHSGISFSDAILRDESVVSAKEIEKYHPSDKILRKVLVKEKLESINELMEKYVNYPICW